MLAVALFIVVSVPNSADPWCLVSRLVLLISVINLVASAQIESRRPLRRDTAVRRKLFRNLEE
jgi:hypothetical protein